MRVSHGIVHFPRSNPVKIFLVLNFSWDAEKNSIFSLLSSDLLPFMFRFCFWISLVSDSKSQYTVGKVEKSQEQLRSVSGLVDWVGVKITNSEFQICVILILHILFWQLLIHFDLLLLIIRRMTQVEWNFWMENQFQLYRLNVDFNSSWALIEEFWHSHIFSANNKFICYPTISFICRLFRFDFPGLFAGIFLASGCFAFTSIFNLYLHTMGVKEYYESGNSGEGKLGGKFMHNSKFEHFWGLIKICYWIVWYE